ncbi:MAG: hypothetical protein AABZ63_05400, partial [Actinomycetota bacterium]
MTGLFTANVGGSLAQSVAGIKALGFSGDNNWAGGIDFTSYNGTTVLNRILNSTGGMLFYTGTSGTTDERMRINATGNVGIGTTTPQGLLHVGAGATPGLLVTSAGNVGIGTTGPGAKLHVSGGDVNTASFKVEGSSYVILNAGNVGIGTVNPGSRFEVVGGSSTFKGSDSNSAIAGFTDAGGNYRVVISTAGNVGIGTTGPGAKLHVSGGDVNTASFKVEGSSYVILNAGNVGIGTTGPGALLDITGDGSTVLLPRKSATGNPAGSNGMLYYNTADAKFRCYQNGAWTDCIAAAAGDNLGNHVATTTLQMGVYGVNTSSHISAAAYQINGSTMVAVLPGIDSIAYGVNAGSSSITGGNYNTFIGNQAGALKTAGEYNSLLGYRAGYADGGSYNSFLGAQAGYSTTGSNNSFLGYQAGYSNATGQYNSLLGYRAGYSNTGS